MRAMKAASLLAALVATTVVIGACHHEASSPGEDFTSARVRVSRRSGHFTTSYRIQSERPMRKIAGVSGRLSDSSGAVNEAMPNWQRSFPNVDVAEEPGSLPHVHDGITTPVTTTLLVTSNFFGSPPDRLPVDLGTDPNVDVDVLFSDLESRVTETARVEVDPACDRSGARFFPRLHVSVQRKGSPALEGLAATLEFFAADGKRVSSTETFASHPRDGQPIADFFDVESSRSWPAGAASVRVRVNLRTAGSGDDSVHDFDFKRSDVTARTSSVEAPPLDVDFASARVTIARSRGRFMTSYRIGAITTSAPINRIAGKLSETVGGKVLDPKIDAWARDNFNSFVEDYVEPRTHAHADLKEKLTATLISWSEDGSPTGSPDEFPIDLGVDDYVSYSVYFRRPSASQPPKVMTQVTLAPVYDGASFRLTPHLVVNRIYNPATGINKVATSYAFMKNADEAPAPGALPVSKNLSLTTPSASPFDTANNYIDWPMNAGDFAFLRVVVTLANDNESSTHDFWIAR